MNDIDAELKRLRKLRAEVYKEMAEYEAQRNAAELKRLTYFAGLAAISSYVLSLLSEASLPHVSQKATAVAGFCLVIISFLIIFLVKAHRSPLSISGYLKIEKTLLINEMPNIFQILSLLGFLNVFLATFLVKVLVTILLTFLLLVYITSKRSQMIAKSPKLKKQVALDITVLLSIVLGCIVGATVYGMAWLIAAQAR